MALWLVRAGEQGETIVLEKNLAVVGWNRWHVLPDLAGIERREELYKVLEETFPG